MEKNETKTNRYKNQTFFYQLFQKYYCIYKKDVLYSPQFDNAAIAQW